MTGARGASPAGPSGPAEAARDPRFEVLFEPVRIGPLTARNRFYQVPHCNGMGYRDPSAAARMRGIKAEGGWALVCTEQAEIHHSSEITPYIELRIWDEQDLPALARMADAVHEHGALAGIELCCATGGSASSTSYPASPPIATAGSASRTRCVFTGGVAERAADAVLLVTARLPEAGIAAAVYAGHRYARELDTVVDRDLPAFRREVAALAPI